MKRVKSAKASLLIILVASMTVSACQDSGSKEEVAAHLVNLAWNGLGHLDPKPAVSKG